MDGTNSGGVSNHTSRLSCTYLRSTIGGVYDIQAAIPSILLPDRTTVTEMDSFMTRWSPKHYKSTLINYHRDTSPSKCVTVVKDIIARCCHPQKRAFSWTRPVQSTWNRQAVTVAKPSHRVLSILAHDGPLNTIKWTKRNTVAQSFGRVSVRRYFQQQHI